MFLLEFGFRRRTHEPSERVLVKGDNGAMGRDNEGDRVSSGLDRYTSLLFSMFNYQDCRCLYYTGPD